MDFQQLFQKLYPIFNRNKLVLALGFFGLIFLVYGLIVLIGSLKSASNSFVFEPDAGETKSPSKTTKEIAIDIEGAVINPGIFKLSQDARIKDALIAAGGLSEEADRDWVAKNLNLAVKLTDGTKIYIPKVGDGVKGITGNSANGQININTASIQELVGLPGIGAVTAQKIIDGRPYGSIDDLFKKKVVSRKVFEKIKERVTVY